VRQLLPDAQDEVDPVALHAALDRPAPERRPWVLLNMISSADGGTAVDGVSGGLGGQADKKVFAALRTLPDVILVGAATVEAERYGPPRPSPDVQEARRGRGQRAKPRLVVVSGSLSCNLSLPLFADADDDNRPLVVTGEAAEPNLIRATESVAEVRVLGERHVDLPALLAALRSEGARVVLAEGGPSLNGALVAADLVDELCLSLSPTLAGGDSARIVRGAPSALRSLVLERVLEEDGLLFFRYLRGGGSS
jgi:riboflavin-specific deaminase-like protein